MEEKRDLSKKIEEMSKQQSALAENANGNETKLEMVEKELDDVKHSLEDRDDEVKDLTAEIKE